MNKLFTALMLISLVFFALPTFTLASPANVKVTVCGESAGDVEAAKLDARKKAVGRVLSKMISPNRDKDSLFQQLINRQKDFTGELKILDKKTEDGRLYLVSLVEVKTALLQDALTSKIGEAGNKEQDSEVCFLIRLKGVDTAGEIAGGRTVYNAYKDAFEQLGFKIAAYEDEILREFQHSRKLDFNSFSRALENKIKLDFPGITIAVIGEIDVTLLQKDEMGQLVATKVYIRALDMLRQKEIAAFTDSYQIKWPDAKEAAMVAVHKSAINSSAALADKTLSYWQKVK